MDDVMKKRLTGVTVLVALGIFIPVLVSRCVGGADQDQNGSMRVYEISPNGKAQSASDGSINPGQQHNAPSGREAAAGTSGGDSGPASSQHADLPDAISPDSVPRSQQASAADNGSFSTPPVQGNGATTANTQSPAQAPEQPSSAAHNTAGNTTSASGSNRAARAQSAPQAGTGEQSLEHSGSAGHGWVVQVASFGKADHAQSLAQKLNGRFKAFYRPADVKGKTYYRVAIGPFDQEHTARQTADRLRQQGRKPLVRHLP